jgi:hypothetical protein
MKRSKPANSLCDSAAIIREWPENMRPKKAAEYLGLSQAFLDQARCSGTGPKFVRVSRTCILYRKADLDSFLAGRLFTSTAEADRREALAQATATSDNGECFEASAASKQCSTPAGRAPRKKEGKAIASKNEGARTA